MDNVQKVNYCTNILSCHQQMAALCFPLTEERFLLIDIHQRKPKNNRTMQ
jgi:hypothetical protein